MGRKFPEMPLVESEQMGRKLPEMPLVESERRGRVHAEGTGPQVPSHGSPQNQIIAREQNRRHC
jgi:hypothetical protein